MTQDSNGKYMKRSGVPLRCELLEQRTVPVTFSQDGFLATTVASDLRSPISMDIAADGRVFFTEQTGTLRVIDQGQLVEQPVLRVDVDTYFERGLLGVAVSDDLVTNPFVYVYYTPVHPEGTTATGRLSRFRLIGNQAEPGSEQVLFEVPGFQSGHHIGGSLEFGPDGKLYLGIGDDGVQLEESQNLGTLFGSVLRLNPDGTIPADNPFTEQLQGPNRAIWAYGLRNPFTLAFDSLSGRMFINEVGGNAFEEINEGMSGANYGWPRNEGLVDEPGYTSPLLAIAHNGSEAGGFAIAGGAFYNPSESQFPQSFLGRYFYSDYVLGKTRWYDPITAESGAFATELPFPVDLEIAPDGSMYVLARGVSNIDAVTDQQRVDSGSLIQIQYSPESPPFIDVPPEDRLVGLGQAAAFEVLASGAGDLTYQWRRDGSPIPGANQPRYHIDSTQIEDSGSVFQVVVSNPYGQVISQPAHLMVINNQAPELRLSHNLPGGHFVAGEVYQLSVTGHDPETGPLPGEAFTWRIDYHTGPVRRPGVGPVAGVTALDFTVPRSTPFLETNVFYRVHVSATDQAGLTGSVELDLLPEVAEITLGSELPGSVWLNGERVDDHIIRFDSVAGVTRRIEATPVIWRDGQRYYFDHWSDAGDRARVYAAPVSDTTLEAVYQVGEPYGQYDISSFAVGAGAGGGPVVSTISERMARPPFFAFEPGLMSGVTIALADVTGDHVPDTIVGTGPGTPARVRIFDGNTNDVVQTFSPFEPTFLGGVFVAAGDITGDRIADVAISAGEGGGARVRLFDGVTGEPLADWLGIEDPGFRGGAQIALGDLDGDQLCELVVAPAAQGGPRIAVFAGASLSNHPVKIFGDFFAFEPSLRQGLEVSVGDMDGDGFSDLVLGAGLGGGPRVLTLSGRQLLLTRGADRTPLNNFFAGPIDDRAGTRLVVKDLDGDPYGDLVVGAAPGSIPGYRTYLGRHLQVAAAEPEFTFTQVLTDDFLGGVFVG